jgi:hypothetical protein
MILEENSRGIWTLKNGARIRYGYNRKLYQFKKDLSSINDNAESFVFEQFLNSKKNTITIIPNILIHNSTDLKYLSRENSNLNIEGTFYCYHSIEIGYLVIRHQTGSKFNLKFDQLGKLWFIKHDDNGITQKINIFSKLVTNEPEANWSKLENICKIYAESFYNEWNSYLTPNAPGLCLKYKGVANSTAMSKQLSEFMTINSDKFVPNVKTLTLDKNVLEKVKSILTEIKEENKKENAV